MNLKNIAKGIASVAPGLASVLIPGGPLVGAAIKAVSAAVLGHGDGTEDEIAVAVQGLTSEQKAALYAADIDFKKAKLAADLRKDEMVIEDRSSARTRDIAYVQAARHNVRGDVLAYGAVFLMVLFLVLIFFKQIPESGPTRDILFTMAGIVAGLLKDVYGFEFGSSRGSETKTAMLGDGGNGKA